MFAVCLAKVQYRNSQEFRYYDFIQADSEEAFNDYLDHIIQLSVFTGTDLPAYGDELLTLSTCNNFTEDGRLFLVAKKCRKQSKSVGSRVRFTAGCGEIKDDGREC